MDSNSRSLARESIVFEAKRLYNCASQLPRRRVPDRPQAGSRKRRAAEGNTVAEGRPLRDDAAADKHRGRAIEVGEQALQAVDLRQVVDYNIRIGRVPRRQNCPVADGGKRRRLYGAFGAGSRLGVVSQLTKPGRYASECLLDLRHQLRRAERLRKNKVRVGLRHQRGGIGKTRHEQDRQAGSAKCTMTAARLYAEKDGIKPPM